MNGISVLNKVVLSPAQKIVLGVILLVLVWATVFWQGLTTAFDIWVISDTFNHCLLVLPGALYLVYLKRSSLSPFLVHPNYLVLVLCLGCLLLYAIGLAGDVQLFMHVATFAFLPLSIWTFIGNKLAYKIMFPLFFILFSIPIGEELIPTLQQITADLAVIMLNWTAVPIFRTGLYIEVPQGRFLVAEACSGISFFIASIVIGSLYAHLNIQSTQRKVVFVLISILFPIIANAIRVYGIILIGYLSNMEHAVGVDHLIYGWIFFSLVILCLLGIGELIREKNQITNIPVETRGGVEQQTNGVHIRALGSLILFMAVFAIWFELIKGQHVASVSPQRIDNNLSENIASPSTMRRRSQWTPEFIEPFDSLAKTIDVNGVVVDIFMVWYPKGHGELISSLNKLYHEKEWTIDSHNTFQTSDGIQFPLKLIVDSKTRRLLSYWYVIDGKVFTDKHVAKLYEIYRIMLGTHIGSGLIAMSRETETALQENDDRIVFQDAVENHVAAFSQHFPF